LYYGALGGGQSLVKSCKKIQVSPHHESETLQYYQFKQRIYFISFYLAKNNLINWDKFTEWFMTNQRYSHIANETYMGNPNEKYNL